MVDHAVICMELAVQSHRVYKVVHLPYQCVKTSSRNLPFMARSCKHKDGASYIANTEVFLRGLLVYGKSKS